VDDLHFRLAAPTPIPRFQLGSRESNKGADSVGKLGYERRCRRRVGCSRACVGDLRVVREGPPLRRSSRRAQRAPRRKTRLPEAAPAPPRRRRHGLRTHAPTAVRNG
jgi:hypothetical protein